MDNVALAFACDLSRVITLTLGDGDGVHAMPWLGSEFSAPPVYTNDDAKTRTHHDITHVQYQDATQTMLKTKTETWYSEQFAYLLGKLDAIPEGNGTMLDNTVVAACAAGSKNRA